MFVLAFWGFLRFSELSLIRPKDIKFGEGANFGVSDRNLLHYGRWASVSARNSYVKDSLASRLKVSKSLPL